MYQPQSKFRKVLAGSVATCLLVFYMFVPPLQAKGDIISLIIVVLAVTAGGGAVYDYNSCGLNVIWGCNNNGGGAGAGGRGGDDRFGNDDDNDNNNNDERNGGIQNGNGTGTGGSGSGGQACSSSPNACGMTSTGFTDAQGQCAALPPPVSSCPTPVFGAFTADPDLVRSGNRTTLSWEVSDATACSLSGGGLNLLSLGLTGTEESNPITTRTEFTLTCFNGDPAEGAPSTSETEVVNLIPAYEEI